MRAGGMQCEHYVPESVNRLSQEWVKAIETIGR